MQDKETPPPPEAGTPPPVPEKTPPTNSGAQGNDKRTSKVAPTAPTTAKLTMKPAKPMVETTAEQPTATEEATPTATHRQTTAAKPAKFTPKAASPPVEHREQTAKRVRRTKRDERNRRCNDRRHPGSKQQKKAPMGSVRRMNRLRRQTPTKPGKVKLTAVTE
ncbi:MAG: hypothetical protein R3E79_17310 [Caldilineaceae bacterium]